VTKEKNNIDAEGDLKLVREYNFNSLPLDWINIQNTVLNLLISFVAMITLEL
jgi:hypothetical protein